MYSTCVSMSNPYFIIKLFDIIYSNSTDDVNTCFQRYFDDVFEACVQQFTSFQLYCVFSSVRGFLHTCTLWQSNMAVQNPPFPNA